MILISNLTWDWPKPIRFPTGEGPEQDKPIL